MSYHGDIRLGETIDVKFTSRRFSTGAPHTLAGSPVISAYVGNGTTEITAGITLTVDFDGRTGLNNVRVVATSGNGFATATNVQLVITTGTVDSVSVVGEVVGSFSIENRSALMPVTAGRTVVVDPAGLVDANTVKVGPTGAGTAQTAGDVNATLVTLGGYIDTEVASILAAVDTEVGAIKAKTDLIPASPAAVGSAMTLAANAITTASIADDAITDAKIAVPAETAGRPTRVLAMMRRGWEWLTNKRTRDRATGTVLLRNEADTATLETQTQSTAGDLDTQTKGV